MTIISFCLLPPWWRAAQVLPYQSTDEGSAWHGRLLSLSPSLIYSLLVFLYPPPPHPVIIILACLFWSLMAHWWITASREAWALLDARSIDVLVFFFFSFLFFPVALISREEESVERCYFLASIWRWKTLSYNRDPLLSTVRLGDNLHSMISDRFPSPSSLCLVATSCLYPIAAIARRAYNS